MVMKAQLWLAKVLNRGANGVSASWCGVVVMVIVIIIHTSVDLPLVVAVVAAVVVVILQHKKQHNVIKNVQLIMHLIDDIFKCGATLEAGGSPYLSGT